MTARSLAARGVVSSLDYRPWTRRALREELRAKMQPDILSEDEADLELDNLLAEGILYVWCSFSSAFFLSSLFFFLSSTNL
jgi:hypothetical protein